MTPFSPHSPIGCSFSREVIDASVLPVVSKDLLPWLLKDRREAVEGSSFWNAAEGKDQHDRMGLTYAQRELRRIESDLASEKPLPGGGQSERAAILTIQRNQQAAFVRFWEGKCYLLDKVIEATRARDT